jgi:parallel beta-helix repeat protein
MRNLICIVVTMVTLLVSAGRSIAAGGNRLTNTEGLVEYFANQQTLDTIVSGVILKDTTWNLAGSPYIVTGGGGIIIGGNATLTIEPGVVVKFNPHLAIAVGSAAFGKGNLVARGTEQFPITFTSIKDPNDPCDPAQAGDWSRIHFTDYSVDATYDSNDNYLSGGILEHVVVEYAGYGNYGAIFAEKSSPFLNYSEVRHNSYYGIMNDGTDAPVIHIANCHIYDHPQRGIYITGGVGGHKLLYNNINDNHDGGIYLSGNGNSNISNILTGNTISGNIASYGGGIYLQYNSNILTGNTISGNTSSSGGGIYLELGGISNISNILTGNTISGNTASYGGGGILVSNASNNILTGNTISDNTASNGGGIYCYAGSNNTLNGNIVQNNTSNNGTGAIYLSYFSDTTLSRNTITDNHFILGKTGGIYVTYYSEHLSLKGDPNALSYNTIKNNDGYQIYNDNPFSADGRYDVNALYVQWGTCDLDVIQSLIFDYFDDGTKAIVLFYPIACQGAPGDFDIDGDVDWSDLAIFVENWLRQDCAAHDWCNGTDLDLSTQVDFKDFAIFAEHWLEGVEP